MTGLERQYIAAAMRNNLFSLTIILIFVLSLVTEWYRMLSVVFFIVLLVVIIDKLGKGLVLRELVALYTVFICLIVPILGYEVYNQQNFMAYLFKRYMRVSEDFYFSFTLPATSIFTLALCWPMKDNEILLDEGAFLSEKIEYIRNQLSSNIKPGLILVAIGISISFIIGDLPKTIRFFGELFFFSSFAGILYIYFAPKFKSKPIVLFLFLFFIIWGALKTGMFTVVAYMGITIFSFFFLGKKTSFLRKITVLFAGIFIFIVIQNTKTTYRKYIWQKDFTGDRGSLFVDIFMENIQKGNALFDERAFFPIHTRINQGFNISLVMNRIPSVKPFDNGNALSTVIISSFVPRFLWPDKPEAGGKFNMSYYAGWNIIGFATNVGPLGEAYGSFGIAGGIIYMFLLGIFIRWAYKRVFLISKRVPVVIFWIPVLFYQATYSAENDTLQILNSLIKTAVFVFLLYKLFPLLFFGKSMSHMSEKALTI